MKVKKLIKQKSLLFESLFNTVLYIAYDYVLSRNPFWENIVVSSDSYHESSKLIGAFILMIIFMFSAIPLVYAAYFILAVVFKNKKDVYKYINFFAYIIFSILYFPMIYSVFQIVEISKYIFHNPYSIQATITLFIVFYAINFVSNKFNLKRNPLSANTRALVEFDKTILSALLVGCVFLFISILVNYILGFFSINL